jgi:long-subunit fatty acid transport protein
MARVMNDTSPCRCRSWSVFAVLVLAAAVHAQPVTTPEIGTAPNPVGSGARAMGQGNAFIAVADDATAASWNPGGLSQLQRPEVSLAVEHLRQSEQMGSDVGAGAESERNIDLTDLNYASVVYPFFFRRNMVVSLNYLKQYRFDKALEYPLQSSAGGIDLGARVHYRQEGEFATLAPAFGIDVTPHLALGVTLNIWNHAVTGSSAYEQESSTAGSVQFGPFRDTFRHVLQDRFEIDRGTSLVLGGLYRLSAQWTLGAVVKPAYALHLDHTRTETYTESGTLTPPDEDTQATTTAHARLDLPLVAGLGVAWRPSDPLTVSTDVTWTDWSNCAYTENGRETNPFTIEPVSRSELDDTVTARLGVEYLLIRQRFVVPLRCGAGYDPSPAVDGVDEFYSLTCGSGLQWGRFVFDIAYEYRWGRDVGRDVLRGIHGAEDMVRQRLLASMIVYF